MGRPKPHKSLPIPQITEKTLKHRVKYGRGAEHLFWIGRLNCADACLPPARQYRAGDLRFCKAMMRERGCRAPVSWAAQLRFACLPPARQYRGDSSDFCAERFEGVD